MTDPTPIRHAVITPAGDVFDVTSPLTPQAVHDTLLGSYNAISAPSGAVALYGRKAEGSNWLATQWLRNRLYPGQVISGEVIVTGKPNADGEVTDIGDDDFAELRSMAK